MNYIEINKKAWDQRTQVHAESQFYDVESFLGGKSSLNTIELALLGKVKNKNVLHLQCHFGQDTLSLARLGAKVTGVDLSFEAIEKAKYLAKEIGSNAEFVCEDVYQFGETNKTEFDIVYTSYGVLCWLPDLDLWAETVAKSLKKGGELCLVEFHAFNDLISGYSYFPSSKPDVESEGTYTENCKGEKSTVVTWPHSLSNVIQALINAGINIEQFSEHAYSPYPCSEGLDFVEGFGYQKLINNQQIPLLYAIKGRKIV
ncbi:class I SAM-dependent methyltransferase [Pseudoalteromonas denitrificans]|uniref:Methyltransferase domain-containing protein n=1 Tax=Pseudoalteromonas denitrificans DSM 6059 TaxID=1123010 RepID=A0A1I1U4K0_9GAMM|nr:class I SAM-dependent methyltransferase [Pseudoalteromonas denitrificans]SFD65624.1 Methyltransferase domain-containing protein [Pseudoalteromonas denitrificans DSM 6059]